MAFELKRFYAERVCIAFESFMCHSYFKRLACKYSTIAFRSVH